MDIRNTETMLKDFFDRIPYLGLQSQRRFSWLMHLNRSVLFQKPVIVGLENLTKIPKLPLIIVVSHFSDADLQIAASVLQSKLKQVRPGHLLGLSLQSENLIDLKSAFLIKAAGKRNFFEIDARYDQKTGKLNFTFNPANFQKMAAALLNQTDIIIAAHEPLSNIPNSEWQLPDRAGLGMVYLAQLTQAVLLPVAIDIQSNQPVGMSGDIKGAAKRLIGQSRPGVRAIIGQPFVLEKIDQTKMAGQRICDLPAFDQLKGQGEIVMKAIAALLPAEKRGKWKD